MSSTTHSRHHTRVIGGLVAVVVVISSIAALVGFQVSAEGGNSPGATHIAQSLAGPGGPAMTPLSPPERDPSVPAAASVFANTLLVAGSDSPTF